MRSLYCCQRVKRRRRRTLRTRLEEVHFWSKRSTRTTKGTQTQLITVNTDSINHQLLFLRMLILCLCEYMRTCTPASMCVLFYPYLCLMLMHGSIRKDEDRKREGVVGRVAGYVAPPPS